MRNAREVSQRQPGCRRLELLKSGQEHHGSCKQDEHDDDRGGASNQRGLISSAPVFLEPLDCISYTNLFNHGRRPGLQR